MALLMLLAMTASAQKVRKTQPYTLYGEDKYHDVSTVLFGLGTATPLTRFHVVGDNTYSAFFMNGNVGLGTTMPGYTLDVNGTIRSSMLSGGSGLVQYDSNGALLQLPFSQNVQDVLRGDGSWGSYSDGHWQLSGNDLYSIPSGNVGIGIIPTIYKLDILGNVHVGGSLFADDMLVSGLIKGGRIESDTLSTGKMLVDTSIRVANSIIIDGTNDRIYSTSGNIDFMSTNLSTTGTLTAGGLDVGGMITFDSLQVNGNINASGIIKSGNSIYIDGTLNTPGFPSTIYADDNVLTISGGIPANPNLNNIKVGIGTKTPVRILHIRTIHAGAPPATHQGIRLEDVVTTPNAPSIYNIWDITPIISQALNNAPVLYFQTPDTKVMILQDNGDVFIPNGKLSVGLPGLFLSGPHSNYQLAVNGKVVAQKYIATMLNWADDEFDKELTLDDLEKEERHVEKNSHLEGIPSGKEVEKDGIDLAEMSGLQMRKIEQVFLYLFKFNAAIKQLTKKMKETANANKKLRKENKYLKNELADLKKRVEKLEHSK